MVNLEDIVRPNILQLLPYSSARDEFTGDEGVFLDANENPYGQLNRYPDPYQTELKQQLSKLKRVNSDNIFIGNGSDEVIDLAFRIFCRPGVDKALTFTPSYGMYTVSAAINDVELLELPLNDTFQIDLKQLDPYLSDSSLKLIFICSPNNPTGNLMRLDTIESILTNFNGIVIIDEAYIDFAEADSMINLINAYNNLIVSQTFSKAWGLAAARVGTGYSSVEMITLFNKVKPPYNVSSLNQEAALSALDNYADYEKMLGLILEEKDRLRSKLSTIPAIKHIYPSDSNFLLIKVENSTKLYNELVQHTIITRNRHKQVANCIRISVGTPEENDALINALQKLI